MNPHPLNVLDRIETQHHHPAGSYRNTSPMDTAQEFHDEIDAQTGRRLPRHIEPAEQLTGEIAGPSLADRIAGTVLFTLAAGWIAIVLTALTHGGIS